MTKRALLLAMLFSMPAVARAQDAAGGGVTNANTAPANISVADRFRPEYEPIGGRVGSFFLYPRVDLTALYNTNLRGTPTNEISDVVFTVRPAATLDSRWGRHALSLNTYYLTALHGKTGSENYDSYGIGTNGRLDAGRTTTLLGSASFDKLAEPRTDFNNIAASRAPLQYRNYNAGVTVNHSFVAFDASARASINKQDFDDAVSLSGTPIDLGFRDNTRYNGAIDLRKRLATGTSALIHLETDRIKFDENPINGIDRNSRSYRVEGGVGLAVSRLIYGDVRVGYFRQKNDDPRFEDTTGLSFSANVLYSVTQLTSVRVNAERTVDPGGSTVTSGNVRSTVAVTVDHELMRNLIVTGFARYSHINPQNLATFEIVGADEYEGRLAARYYLNRRFRLNASVSHFKREAGALNSIDVSLASVGVTVML